MKIEIQRKILENDLKIRYYNEDDKTVFEYLFYILYSINKNKIEVIQLIPNKKINYFNNYFLYKINIV